MASTSDILTEIAGQIQKARLTAGLTQAQVAELAGLSRPRYREIEAGQTATRLNSLINIARALGLELLLVPQSAVPMIDAVLELQADDDEPAFQPMSE